MTYRLIEFIKTPNLTFSIGLSGDGWFSLTSTNQGRFYPERHIKSTQTSHALSFPYECYSLAFTDLEGLDLNELRLGALTQGLILGAPLIEQDKHRLAQLKHQYGLTDNDKNPSHRQVQLGDLTFDVYCSNLSPDILWFVRSGSMEDFIPFHQIRAFRSFLLSHEPLSPLNHLEWEPVERCWTEPLIKLLDSNDIGILDLEHDETDFFFALLMGVPLQKLMGWLVEE